jgi:hypothetical protein
VYPSRIRTHSLLESTNHLVGTAGRLQLLLLIAHHSCEVRLGVYPTRQQRIAEQQVLLHTIPMYHHPAVEQPTSMHPILHALSSFHTTTQAPVHNHTTIDDHTNTQAHPNHSRHDRPRHNTSRFPIMYPELSASGFGVLSLAFCTLRAGWRGRVEAMGRVLTVASTT